MCNCQIMMLVLSNYLFFYCIYIYIFIITVNYMFHLSTAIMLSDNFYVI